MEPLDNLLALYERAPRASLATDLDWYRTARDIAAERAERQRVPLDRYLAATAAMSPLKQWQTKAGRYPNLDAVDRVIAGKPTGLKRSIAHAQALLAGARPADELGPKTLNFYRALTGDNQAVTIDVWMMRAMFGANAPSAPRASQYARLEQIIRDAAATAQVAPRDFQAAVWTQIKREWTR